MPFVAEFQHHGDTNPGTSPLDTVNVHEEEGEEEEQIEEEAGPSQQPPEEVEVETEEEEEEDAEQETAVPTGAESQECGEGDRERTAPGRTGDILQSFHQRIARLERLTARLLRDVRDMKTSIAQILELLQGMLQRDNHRGKA
ncbi:bone sialoprotein 2-like [Sphaerodactylus townsendi]|uniref:bone sialoprotein 2-like n=1 Tax=Sphaerodactylus townsendi TaxID=933632 RepID=UPI002026083E|nr:bone sialoprotein 2-like [Sphaerodactylus townsendi]